jgi:hypothetical protein
MIEPDIITEDRVATSKEATAPPMGRWAKNAWRLSVLPLLAFFLIPVVVIFTRTTPARIFASLSDPQVYLGLAVSLKTTLISLGLILVFGSPVAFLLGRFKFRLKNLIETLIDLPTVLPPSVAGLALLLAFGRNGPIGSYLSHWGISLAFTPAAVIMAQIFIASPYYIRSASIGKRPRDLVQLARRERDAPRFDHRRLRAAANRHFEVRGADGKTRGARFDQEVRQDRKRRPFFDDPRDGLKLSDEVALLDHEFHGVLVPSPKKLILPRGRELAAVMVADSIRRISYEAEPHAALSLWTEASAGPPPPPFHPRNSWHRTLPNAFHSTTAARLC